MSPTGLVGWISIGSVESVAGSGGRRASPVAAATTGVSIPTVKAGTFTAVIEREDAWGPTQRSHSTGLVRRLAGPPERAPRIGHRCLRSNRAGDGMVRSG